MVETCPIFSIQRPHVTLTALLRPYIGNLIQLNLIMCVEQDQKLAESVPCIDAL